jgi:hypothetical protein
MSDGDHAAAPIDGEGPLRCPFCDATTVVAVAPFGSQLLMSQFRCEACRSYFEGVRPDRYEVFEAAPASPPAPGPTPGEG